MFHHIEGVVSEIGHNLAVIDCGGIGFELNTTLNTLSYLRTGEKARLYVTEAIKEDAFDLYGFSTKSERRFFEMLISVSGIGPKAALSILSANTPDSLAFAVLNNNEKALTVAPGIGKKIAQRVILELKDKIGAETESVDFTPPPAVSAGESSAVSEAVAALTVLGFGNAEIAAAMKKIDTSSMTAEQITKAVLRTMAQ
ncbi:MAG: Holliday junction branch migration protein RuvA [Oscillospiraceae bacterium]|nr:Holliday junction branch migration protein RuvA [Oscillospiraceae bacterium]